MSKKQIYTDVIRLIKAMQQTPGDRQRLTNLVWNVDEVLKEMAWQERRAAQPVVFAFHPGYVLIGFEDDYKTIPAPIRLVGLYAAWEIFLHGDNAPFVFFAADRGMSPNSLDNALGRAAKWVEPYCMPLAVAIRAIKVRVDGSASFDPAYVPPLRLNVESAWSTPFPSLPRDSIGVSNWTKEPHHERTAEDRGYRQGKGGPRADP